MSVAFGIWSALCAVTGLGCPEVEVVIAPPVQPSLEVAENGTITLPSGLIVTEHEVRLEPVGVPMGSVDTVRLRYVGEMLAMDDVWNFERIEGDFPQLCASFGLPRRTTSAPNATQIIISMASEASDFGDSVPQVVQYFDSYKVVDNACIWEG